MIPDILKPAKAFAALALLVIAGCTTVEKDSGAPRPGDGVRAYQQQVADFRAALADCVRAVEKLAVSSEKSSAAAYSRVQSTAQRLEVGSIKARSRAEALETRGEAYFHEWAEEAAAGTDEASRREARNRFEALRGHFVNVQHDSRRVREDGRKFFESLRRWRATLGAAPQAAAVERARADFAPAAAAGRAALESVNRLSQTLAAAEVAVMKAAKP